MNTETVAHRMTRGIHPGTGWNTEVWVVRETDNTPRDRVTLYMYKGVWFAWTSDTVNADKIRERTALAGERNGTPSTATAIRLRAGS